MIISLNTGTYVLVLNKDSPGRDYLYKLRI